MLKSILGTVEQFIKNLISALSAPIQQTNQQGQNYENPFLLQDDEISLQ
jgi:hypothetical protein